MTYPPKIDPKKETEKITNFIKTTFENANKLRAVVAISGGIDSCTALVLSTKALTPKNIYTLQLPSRYTQKIHTQHANQVLDLAKIPTENRFTIPITAILQKTWRIVKHYTQYARETNSRQAHGPGKKPGKITNEEQPAKKNPLSFSEFCLPEHYSAKGTKDRKNINAQIAQLNRIRLGNIAARARMMVIFDHAKRIDGLVVGTENKSEHLLGYYTRFGDEASDLEPIRHLYKTQIYELAKYLKIPPEIITKPPTASLWPNQTDEAELGFSYKQADPILFLQFEKNMSPAEIASELSSKTQKNTKEIESLIKKVLTQSQNTAFKHQVPYSIE